MNTAAGRARRGASGSRAPYAGNILRDLIVVQTRQHSQRSHLGLQVMQIVDLLEAVGCQDLQRPSVPRNILDPERFPVRLLEVS